MYWLLLGRYGRGHEQRQIWIFSCWSISRNFKVERSRDFEDALSVLERLQDRFDLAYLGHWARRLGVREELGHIAAFVRTKVGQGSEHL